MAEKPSRQALALMNENSNSKLENCVADELSTESYRYVNRSQAQIAEIDQFVEAVNIENHYCCDVSNTDVLVCDFHIPDHVESSGSEV